MTISLYSVAPFAISLFLVAPFAIMALGVLAVFIFFMLKRKALSQAGHSGSVIHHSRTRSRGTFIMLAGPMFTIIGGAATVFGILNIAKGAESANWPSVRGEMITSEVQSRMETKQNHQGTGSRRRTRTSTTRVYWPELKYSYVVEGASFEGSRLGSGLFSRSSQREGHDEVVKRYPAGETVLVYYDPSDWEYSVLEPGLAGSAFLLPLIGGILTLIGLVMLFLFFRPRTEGH
ncbi:MAG: DUF3592 domain-containing protein [Planctomycetota bacterium]|nr:DUF3592 domain-containing protein [Planctomycetota bacterium]